MESDRGILRQAVQEVLAVEGGVGGRLRGIIKEVVSEELQQFRTEIMRLVQKQHSSANWMFYCPLILCVYILTNFFATQMSFIDHFLHAWM